MRKFTLYLLILVLLLFGVLGVFSAKVKALEEGLTPFETVEWTYAIENDYNYILSDADFIVYVEYASSSTIRFNIYSFLPMPYDFYKTASYNMNDFLDLMGIQFYIKLPSDTDMARLLNYCIDVDGSGVWYHLGGLSTYPAAFVRSYSSQDELLSIRRDFYSYIFAVDGDLSAETIAYLRSRLDVIAAEEYSKGLTDGYESGYSEGVDAGYATGYAEGYASGGTGVTSLSWIRSIFSSIGVLLAIELLPNVTIGMVVGIPFVLSVVGLIMRLTRGGGGKND